MCRWVSYKYGYSFLRFSRTVIGTLPLKIFENSIACLQKRCKEGKKILNGLDKTIQNASFSFGKIYIMVIIRNANKGVGSPESLHIIVLPV